MNCRIGESIPGMAISAIWAPFSSEYSVGLNWTWNNPGRPRDGSTAPLSRTSTTAFAGIGLLRDLGRGGDALPEGGRLPRLLRGAFALRDALGHEGDKPLELGVR